MENCYWVGMVDEAPTFHPSSASFHDPYTFVQEIRHILEQYGAAKIVPPHSYVLGSLASAVIKSDNVELELVSQTIQPEGEMKEQMSGRMCLSSDYETKANNALVQEFGTLPPSQPDVEIKFWEYMAQIDAPARNVETPLPLMDSGFARMEDVGSLSDWNLAELHCHPESFLHHFDESIAGLCWGPKVFFRMLYSYVPWKVQGLGSVHYVHTGTGTTWYAIPPAAKGDFEAAKAATCGPMCPQYLKECGVPVFKLCQYAGEIVVVAPLAYNFVVSHGFEIMESTCMGLKQWIDKALFTNPQLPIEYAICKETEFAKQEKVTGRSADAIVHAHQYLLTSIQSDLRFLAPHIRDVQPLPDILLSMKRFYGFKCTACGCYCHLAIMMPLDQPAFELCTQCASKRTTHSGGYKAFLSCSLGVNICRTNGRVETRFSKCPQNTTSRFHIYGALPWEGESGIRSKMASGTGSGNRAKMALQSLWQLFRGGKSCDELGPSPEPMGSHTGVDVSKQVDERRVNSSNVTGMVSSFGNPGVEAKESCENGNRECMDNTFAQSSVPQRKWTGTTEEPEQSGLQAPGQLLGARFQDSQEAANGRTHPEPSRLEFSENDLDSTLGSRVVAKRRKTGENSAARSNTTSTSMACSCGPCCQGCCVEGVGQLIGHHKDRHQARKFLVSAELRSGDSLNNTPLETAPLLIPSKLREKPVRAMSGELAITPLQLGSTVEAKPPSMSAHLLSCHGVQDTMDFSKLTALQHSGPAALGLTRTVHMTAIPVSIPKMPDISQGMHQYGLSQMLGVQQYPSSDLNIPTLQASACTGLSPSLSASNVHLTSGPLAQDGEKLATPVLRVVESTMQDGLRRHTLVPSSGMQPKFLLAEDVLAALLCDRRNRIPASVVHTTIQGLFQRAGEIGASSGMPLPSPPKWGLVDSELHVVLGQEDICALYMALDTENSFRSALERFVHGVWNCELLDNSIVLSTWHQKSSGSSVLGDR